MYKKVLIAVGALALCLSPVAASAVQSDEAQPAADAVQKDDVRPLRGPAQLQNQKTGKCLKGGKDYGQLVKQVTCNKNDNWQYWGDRGLQIINFNPETSSFTCLGTADISTLRSCADGGTNWIGGIPGSDYRTIGSGSGKGCYLKVVDKGAVKCTPGWDTKSAHWRARY